ncbi:MAG: aldehyde dehydrogenase family protein [Phycisphaerae bacterium]|nr:aldehyde dehydrogenase family protein [Phycisphaerae bacterium]
MDRSLGENGARGRPGDGPGARWPLSERVAWVDRFGRMVAGEREELCGLMEAEIGKPRHEGLTADVGALVASCQWHARHAGAVLAERRVIAGFFGGGWLMVGTRAREARLPLGRVGIIATWNYPVQLLGIQLVQAVVGGNAVVVKPSEVAPRTQGRLLEIARRAGLPGGVLAVAPATREAGPAVLRGEFGALDHLVFTGSTAVGREIAAWAGERLLPTTLELSGRDSALVLDDADAVLAARSIWAGVVMNAGQTCTAPRRALVDRRVYGAFVAALAPLASGEKPRALVNESAATRCFGLAEGAVREGGRSISGVLEGVRADGGGRLRAIVPLAIVDCPIGAGLMAGDHFGPVLAVTPVDGEEAMVGLHTRHGPHLAASVFTRRASRARGLAERLGASVVTVNQCVIPTAHPGASLGGRGASGWGVSRGREGLLAMTRGVTVTRTSGVVRPPTEVPTGAAVARLSRLVGWLGGAVEAREAEAARGGGLVRGSARAGSMIEAGPGAGPGGEGVRRGSRAAVEHGGGGAMGTEGAAT